jgi:hypothetical protein
MVNKLKICQVTVNFPQERLCAMQLVFVTCVYLPNVCVDQGSEPVCMAILESVSYNKIPVLQTP